MQSIASAASKPWVAIHGLACTEPARKMLVSWRGMSQHPVLFVFPQVPGDVMCQCERCGARRSGGSRRWACWTMRAGPPTTPSSRTASPRCFCRLIPSACKPGCCCYDCQAACQGPMAHVSEKSIHCGSHPYLFGPLTCRYLLSALPQQNAMFSQPLAWDSSKPPSHSIKHLMQAPYIKCAPGPHPPASC